MSPYDAMQWERRLGGFARMFPRPGATELADAIRAAGLTQIQLNLNSIGVPTIPTPRELEAIDLASVADTFAERELELWGLSATYNMAHFDTEIRRARTRAAADFLAAIPAGTALAATLCTGSRDQHSMWRAHPDNRSESAWRDFRIELDLLLEATTANGMLLGIEPEPGNVVADAAAGARLVAELGADANRIGFILDAANLVSAYPRADQTAILEDAFARIGHRAICIHVKDVVPWENTLAGTGVVDYSTVIALSHTLANPVPLIIQDATEEQVPQILERLRAAILADADSS